MEIKKEEYKESLNEEYLGIHEAAEILEISEEELAKRLKEFKPKEARYKRGVFAKYANTVSSASLGAVTS